VSKRGEGSRQKKSVFKENQKKLCRKKNEERRKKNVKNVAFTVNLAGVRKIEIDPRRKGSKTCARIAPERGKPKSEDHGQ